MYRRILLALLLTAACAAPLSALDRGLGNTGALYIPKGTVSISLTGGYNRFKAIIGYGKMAFGKEMTEYKKFQFIYYQ